MYKKITRLLAIPVLLAATLHPCRAQWVDPGDSPDLKWDVAQLNGGTSYNTLPEAFQNVSADGATIRLLIGVTLDGKASLAVSYRTTLDLNALPLVCASGTGFTLADGKSLTLENGTVSGSFSLSGSGQLFAGADVKIPGLGVTETLPGTTDPRNLYRILVTLPGGESAGAISGVAYGQTTVTRYARSGNRLCCWLPQSVAALAVTFSYTPTGGQPQLYTTAPLIVTQHAENAVPVEKKEGTAGIHVAEVAGSGGSSQSYTTLAEAFTAVKDELTTEARTIGLLANTTLNEQVEITSPIVLDLHNFSLTTSGNAGFTLPAGAAGNGALHIKNGQIGGSFSLVPGFIADRTVTLSAAVMLNGRQVYRVRLLLPDDSAGETLSFSYGNVNNGTVAAPVTEDGHPVAYLWLQARAATSFSLTIGDKTLTKEGISVQANHDNTADLRHGDTEAVLYAAGETPGTDDGTAYGSFHDALNAAGQSDGSQLWLRRDVYFSGVTPHGHPIEANVLTELHLDGHTLTATNCTLDASAPGACLRICDADRGTGRITGTFRIKGDVYIGKDIIGGNIGVVLKGGDATDTQLYRVLVQIDEPGALPDGFADWRLGSLAGQTCYVKDKLACLWLPVGMAPETLTLEINGISYTATVQVSASHSNTVTARKPAVVAAIGAKEYTSLADAFADAANGNTILLKQSTALSVPVTVPDQVNLTVDLQEFTLSMQAAAAFTTSGNGRLLVESSDGRGILSGNFAVTEQVCVSSSVSLTGIVTAGGHTVYRTCFFLPAVSDAGSWEYGAQNGTLFFPGKQNAGGQAVAFGWLQTETGVHDLVVRLSGTTAISKTLTGVMIQANHNNRFDMEAGTSLVQVGAQYYPSFAAALEQVEAAGCGTIRLIADQALRGMQNITGAVVVDLNGHVLSLASDAAFDVAGGATLRVTDESVASDKGYLYGTLSLNGAVYVDPKVKLGGTVIHRGEEVYRLTVDGLPVDAALAPVTYTYAVSGMTGQALLLDGSACLWLPGEREEEDLSFTAKDGTVHETTLFPSLPAHNARQQAFRRVEVDTDVTWADAANKDCNVVVAPGVKLTIATSGQLKTLHRVTMGNGAEIICNEPVLATGGIIHTRSFAVANHWEAFSLPYAPRRITAVIDGSLTELSPYLESGTGGHFWLQALADDGSFSYVAEEVLKANAGYIIAVPDGLTTTGGGVGRAVSFVSAANQFLNRKEVTAVAPEEKGFKQFATGTLHDLPLTRPFYLLNTEGTEYIRQDASADAPVSVPPFSSYLLTDDRTLAVNPTLRMAGLPTATETVVSLSGNDLRVWGGRGCIRVSATEATDLAVYTFGGRLQLCARIPAGESILTLPVGLYIVNRHKIYVNEY